MSQNLPLMRVERMINWPDITNKFHEGKKTTKITLANTRIYETVKKSSVSIYLQGNEIILKSSS